MNDKFYDSRLVMQKVNEMMAGGDDVGLSYIRGIDHFGMTRSPEAMESMKEFFEKSVY